ncbi:odorant-binding protein 2b-like isoform X3 [Equus asinus]|uniref:odorant-binding protein 2b-like isoform X3 n=1 Tax=Equus asinus TaxID=9793 RepID=UPI0038F602AB
MMPSARVGGKRHMYILDLPVKDHHIFYCEGQLGGKAIRIGKLVGRNPDMSLEALEEFKKFAERKGLPQENIIMPVQTGSSSSRSWESSFQEDTQKREVSGQTTAPDPL